MTEPTRDTEPTPHHWGGPDEPIEDEYAQHQREKREAEQRARMDAAHEAAKTERETCGRAMHVDAYAAFKGVTTLCGRPLQHDGDCHPVPLAGDEEDGDA